MNNKHSCVTGTRSAGPAKGAAWRLACSSGIVVIACAASAPDALPNQASISEALTTSAQPSPRQLWRLAAGGAQMVIHIVPTGTLADTNAEAAILAAQGIEFRRILVDPEALTRGDQVAFAAAMHAAGTRSVLFHCDSSVLASAFVAVHRVTRAPDQYEKIREDLLRHTVPRGAVRHFIAERMKELDFTWDDL